MWRDTAKDPKLVFVDYRASLTLLLVIFHLSLWTIGIAIAALSLTAFIQQYGFTPPVALRFIRSYYGGPIRHARDFGVRVHGKTWRRRWELTK